MNSEARAIRLGRVVSHPIVGLHDLIQAQAESTPSRIAVQCGDDFLSYGALADHSNQLAAYLRSQAVGPGKLVAVCAERSLHMIVGSLGILKSGAAYVPIDPAYPEERRRSIMEGADVCMLVTQQSLASDTGFSLIPKIVLDQGMSLISEDPLATVYSDTAPDACAYVIYTSGSTGRPKGVQITHRAVVNLLTCMKSELRVTSNDALLALASFAFDMCIPELYLPLICGGSVIIAPRGMAADGEQLLSCITRRSPTIMQATPTTWSILVHAGFKNRGMRMICGAEPLPSETCAQILQHTDCLYNFYGPTETTVWSMFDVLSPDSSRVTIGRPLDNTRVYLLNEDFEPVPAGVTAELYIGGDGLANGYLGLPGLTAECFLPDCCASVSGSRMYRTMDHARLLSDGRIEFVGRSDRQVKIRGYRIELGEVEEALLRCDGIREAVMSVIGADGNKQLVAYYTGGAIELERLRERLEQQLPEYMVPTVFMQLPSIPRLPNGKVNRHELPMPRSETAATSHFPEPDDDTERFLLRIWRDLLKLSDLRVEDDLFRRGAHSLLVIQAASRVRNEYLLELPLKVIFEARTIRRIAAEIHKRTLLVNACETYPLAEPWLMGLLHPDTLRAKIDELSESEIDALLAEISEASNNR